MKGLTNCLVGTKNDRMLNIVLKYNELMKGAIEGPNCLDKSVCRGDCCSIKIDIPKFLAAGLIEKGYAKKTDFERGEIYSFNIKLNADSTRCIFFDKELNGCSLHQTGLKPPQCWIYPTAFFPGKTDCIHYSNWKIVDTNATKQASELLSEFDDYCKKEFAEEFKPENVAKRLGKLREFLDKTELKPKQISGFIDGWESFSLYSEDDYNISISTVCNKIKCDKEFGKCEKMCDELKNRLMDKAIKVIPKIISEKEPQSCYPLSEIERYN